MFLEGPRSKQMKGNHTPRMRYLSYALPCHSVLQMLKVNMSSKEDCTSLQEKRPSKVANSTKKCVLKHTQMCIQFKQLWENL